MAVNRHYGLCELRAQNVGWLIKQITVRNVDPENLFDFLHCYDWLYNNSGISDAGIMCVPTLKLLQLIPKMSVNHKSIEKLMKKE